MYRYIFKPLLDIIGSLILVIMFTPIILIVAILIYLNMGAPVLFRQVRPGKDEKLFIIYKFRTMKDNPQNRILSDELRLTGLGRVLRRLSLDELPQLINVLKGEMSFIGPRPLLKEYLLLYNEEQKRRHDVKPGITGWAQVNGRNAISWEKKFEYDIFYVKNISFLLDLKIIILTIIKVIKRDGITSKDDVSTSPFRGNKYEK